VLWCGLVEGNGRDPQEDVVSVTFQRILKLLLEFWILSLFVDERPADRHEGGGGGKLAIGCYGLK
jgi:hypothetical protein